MIKRLQMRGRDGEWYLVACKNDRHIVTTKIRTKALMARDLDVFKRTFPAVEFRVA